MSDQLRIRMQNPGPKKILSCDGGIRGMASVEILAKTEADLHRLQKAFYLLTLCSGFITTRN